MVRVNLKTILDDLCDSIALEGGFSALEESGKLYSYITSSEPKKIADEFLAENGFNILAKSIHRITNKKMILMS